MQQKITITEAIQLVDNFSKKCYALMSSSPRPPSSVTKLDNLGTHY